MKIFDSLPLARVMVIGDVMLDRFWWGSVSRISPEAPVPVVRLDRTTITAGGAANVAANIAGLGAAAVLIGIVGDDQEGEIATEAIKRSGVETENILISAERPTTVKTRILAHSQQVARVDQETEDKLSADEESWVTDRIGQHIELVDAVVISDYAKGLLTNPVISVAISKAISSQIPVLVDPKGKDYEKYRGATILTPNRHEAAEACNISESEKDFVLRAGRQLRESLGVSAILITRGEDGMTLFNEQGEIDFGTAAREVYDVTGAGDTVIATLAVSLAAGADLKDATHLANLAAGKVVESLGTTSITLENLRLAFEAS